MSQAYKGPDLNPPPLPKPVEGKVDLPEEKRVSLIRMTVIEEDDGSCKVIEHDLLRGVHRVAAKMPAEQRFIDSDSGDTAAINVAQVRAIVFAQFFEELVNTGKVVLG